MDTTKDAEPNKTPAVGEVTVAEQTPAAAGNPTPSGNLAASKGAEGGPGETWLADIVRGTTTTAPST